jgi:hypothetical protein
MDDPLQKTVGTGAGYRQTRKHSVPFMAQSHELFHRSRNYFLNVTLAIHCRHRCNSRVKAFLEMKVSAVPQQHHTAETGKSGNLAKVDLL